MKKIITDTDIENLKNVKFKSIDEVHKKMKEDRKYIALEMINTISSDITKCAKAGQYHLQCSYIGYKIDIFNEFIKDTLINLGYDVSVEPLGQNWDRQYYMYIRW